MLLLSSDLLYDTIFLENLKISGENAWVEGF
jgi:hypothetical protein